MTTRETPKRRASKPKARSSKTNARSAKARSSKTNARPAKARSSKTNARPAKARSSKTNARSAKTHAANTPPWKRKRPAGQPRTQLSPAQKQLAAARAKRAGRRYPNLVDNMYAATHPPR